MAGFKAAPEREGSSSTGGCDVAEGQVVFVGSRAVERGPGKGSQLEGLCKSPCAHLIQERGLRWSGCQSGSAESANHCRTVHFIFFSFANEIIC